MLSLFKCLIVRYLPFWDVTQRRLVLSCRRFGTTYRVHLRGSSGIKNGPLDS